MEEKRGAHEVEFRNPVADIARNGQVENIFPTPIFYHAMPDCEALNDALRSLILDREAGTPSASKSNIGGWQSQPDFFVWDVPEVAGLLQYVRAALDIATIKVTAPTCLRAQFDVFGWAAVNRKGHYNAAHLHPGSTWSGVYYVDPGDDGGHDAPSGQLEFLNPVTAAGMTFFPSIITSSRLVEPRAGLLVLFPSYLLHAVRLYHGERPRICVPFNAHMREA